MSVLVFPKGSSIQVSLYFKASEFDCPCGQETCTETRIDPELLIRLDFLRKALGCPITITEGYRCEWRQSDLKRRGYETAKGVSQHTLGRACDLRTGKHRGSDLAYHARQCGFRAVGVGRYWIHVDTRSDRDRSWGYLRS